MGNTSATPTKSTMKKYGFGVIPVEFNQPQMHTIYTVTEKEYYYSLIRVSSVFIRGQ